MTQKLCRGCGEVRSLADFHRHSQMADGHLNFCKLCVRKRIRNHRLSGHEPGYEVWERRNPQLNQLVRRTASTVSRAIKRGLLIRPDTCEQCGLDGGITAAHSDYRRPLVVRWLCRSCHVEWDRNAPKTAGISDPDAIRVRRVTRRPLPLSDAERLEICRRAASGEKQSALGAAFGAAQTTISYIIRSSAF